MADENTTLNELAARVTELSAAFTKSIEGPVPTFAADSPLKYGTLSGEAFMTRQKLLDTLNDMIWLAQGPSESIFNYCHNAMPDAACLNTLNQFDFWSAVPVDGTRTYQEISKHVNLPLDVVQRFIKHATTLRLFAETEPGSADTKVRHTSRSAALAQNPGLKALVVVTLETVGGPMMVMHEALERYSRGKTELPNTVEETAFALLHKSGTFGGVFQNSWQQLEEDGEGENKGWRQRNFVTFMNYVKDIFGLEGVIADAHDWKSAGNISVVDLGGSGGHDSIVLAKKFPNLTITVEDLPNAESKFNENVPEDLKSRVSFRPHDFFTPQPVEADIYIIKLIIHDWPDAESIQILQNLRPALKPGARVIIIEYIGDTSASEGPAVPRSLQQYGTATDLRIMALFNAKERSVQSYKNIFEKADKRFEIKKVEHDPISFFATIEAVWTG